MASIFDRYGIKEVADVSFYEINEDGSVGDLKLYLDSLKVSTLNQTASQVTANGGKGNVDLIAWDYGKELTLDIEDALYSPQSMNMMFGNKASLGTVTENKIRGSVSYDLKTVTAASSTGDEFKAAVIAKYTGSNFAGTLTEANIIINGVTDSDGTYKTDFKSLAIGKYIVDYTIKATNASEIVIDAANFPGTYYIVGDTYARSEVTGKDEFFQIVIPKAKMGAENNITLQAEGDPTTFNMTLTVLRPANGEMVKLIQYSL